MAELHLSLMTSLIRTVKLIIDAATAPGAMCNRRVSSPGLPSIAYEGPTSVSGGLGGDEQLRLVKEGFVPAGALSCTII